MAAAFNVHDLTDIPKLYLPRAEQFIQFWDARLIEYQQGAFISTN